MYAPIAHFKLLSQGERLVGHAAPSGGINPCALTLWAGETALYTARATHWSADASQERRRLGWCGFTIHGARRAIALSDDVTIRCATSGAVLARPEIGPGADSAPTTQLSVIDLLTRTRREDGSPDLDAILPFAEYHFRRVGKREFIEATYDMLLRRRVDAIGEQWAQTADRKFESRLISAVMQSDEYRTNPLSFIPGPYHPNFRYDRTPLAI